MAAPNALANMNEPAPKATPEPAATPAPADEDAALAEALAAEEATPEPNPDEEEIEFEGEKIKVPKAVAERVRKFDKAANYKMMQAADERKKVDAERAQFSEAQKIFQTVADDIAEIKGIDKQLEPYLKLTPQDWMAWAEQDRDAASKAQIAITALQNSRGQLINGLNGKVSTARTTEQKAQETQIEEGRKATAAAIPGWNGEKETAMKAEAKAHFPKVTDYALSLIGVDPLVTEVLNDAITLRRLRAKAKTTVKAATAETAVQPTPVPKVGGTAAATKDPENMSASEWRVHREAQLAKRRANR